MKDRFRRVSPVAARPAGSRLSPHIKRVSDPMHDDDEVSTQTANSRLLTIRDVADLAGVSIMTVRRWIYEQGLQIHRLGRLVRISQADLAAFLADKRQHSQFN
jgi:excisionase family DNA binding protein